jgi:hypothetical protein
VPPDRARLLAFGALVVGAIVAVAIYARYFRVHAERVSAVNAAIVDDAAQLESIRARPYVLFRNTALGSAYGRVAAVPLSAPASTRYVTPLACDRVYATKMAGLCLSASRGVFTSYRAQAFDDEFQVTKTFPLEGVPSRTRVSSDGSVAGATVFVSGDSYATDTFSTRTTLYDLRRHTALGNLEDFEVERDGRPFKAIDFNFWGVTFAANPDRFFAVLASARRLYLVEGQVTARRMRVIREGIECPSLSPDGRRIAFKARETSGGILSWRLHVLERETNAESIVNEVRSVDDQAEWLDDAHVLYSLPRNIDGDGSSDVWVARADGTGTPRLLIADAYSPSVVRP